MTSCALLWWTDAVLCVLLAITASLLFKANRTLNTLLNVSITDKQVIAEQQEIIRELRRRIKVQSNVEFSPTSPSRRDPGHA